MRAAVIERPGERIQVEDLRLEEPRSEEMLVRLAASGICHSDLHVRDGDWERPGPLVLGHEGAGVVEAVGPGVDRSLVGRLVALTWYYPCLRCRACQAGRQWACSGSGSIRHRLADGRTPLRNRDGAEVLPYLAIGTMAERAVVPLTAAVPMPNGIAPEVAALIGCCVATGVGAVVKTAALPAGSTAAVWGLGGVGMSVVMGAALSGASRIIAVDRIPAKLDRARQLGATQTIVAGDDPVETIARVRAAAGGDGPEFAFEAIGLQSTVEQAIAVLPPGGTAVLVGLTEFGRRASFEVFPFVDGSRRILGSNYGWAVASVDFPRYAELHLAGRLPIEALVDERIALSADSIESAFDRMRRGEGIRTVIIP